MNVSLKWYASGGGIARTGPFKTQTEAWQALKLADDIRNTTRQIYASDAKVWPEL